MKTDLKEDLKIRMLGITTGGSKLIPPSRNYNGDVVQYHETEEAAKKGVTPFGLPHMLTGGSLSFMAVREDKSNSVDVEIEEIGLAITKPDDIVSQPETQIPIRMKYYEYDYFTERIGSIKLGGRTQQQAWKHEIATKEYQKADVRNYDKTYPSRQERLLGIHVEYKKAAREETIARFKIYDRASRVLDEPPVKYAPESRRKRGQQ